MIILSDGKYFETAASKKENGLHERVPSILILSDQIITLRYYALGHEVTERGERSISLIACGCAAGTCMVPL
jgi:hypothetical protein